jgi:hypothetical protein
VSKSGSGNFKKSKTKKSYKFINLEELPLKMLKRILRSSNPLAVFKETDAILRKDGQSLNATEKSFLVGESLEFLRDSHNIVLRSHEGLNLNKNKNKTISDHRKTPKRDDEFSRKNINKLLMTDKDSRGRHVAKVTFRQEKKKEKLSQHYIDAKNRHLSRQESKDQDPGDRAVARKKQFHAPRAGRNREHPLKASHRMKRKEIAIRRVASAIYVQSQIDARSSRRLKRQEKRKRNKQNAKKRLPGGPLITPEAMDVSNAAERMCKAYGVLAEEAISDLNDDLYDMFMHLYNWMYQMYRSRDFNDYLSACYSFVTSMGVSPTAISRKIKDLAMYFYTLLCPDTKGIVPEGLSSIIDKVSEVFTAVRSSEFLQRIRDFILSIVSLRVLDKDVASSVITYLGKPVKGSIMDSIDAVLFGIKYLLQFAERLMAGESISHCLSSEDPFTSASKEAKRIIDSENMTYSGIPIPGYIDLVTYYRSIDVIISDITKLLERMSKFDTRREGFAKTLRDLVQLRHRVNMTFQCERTTPVAVVLHGPPGIGKSELIKEFARWYSITRGRDFDETHIFNRTQSSEYMEGYSNSKPILHYSEIGNKNAAYVQQKGDEMLPELQSLVDSLPYNANMAFEGKGKVFMTPELILIDTNNKTMHSGILMHDQGAFLRRFLFVEAHVLSEFRIDGGVGIDPVKSMAHPSPMLDRYEFKVTQYQPTSNPNAPIEVNLCGGSINNIKTFMIDYFLDHLHKQEALRDRLRLERGVSKEPEPVLEPIVPEAFEVPIVIKSICGAVSKRVPRVVSSNYYKATSKLKYIGRKVCEGVESGLMWTVGKGLLLIVPNAAATFATNLRKVRVILFILLFLSLVCPYVSVALLTLLFCFSLFVNATRASNWLNSYATDMVYTSTCRLKYLLFGTPYNFFRGKLWNQICVPCLVIFGLAKVISRMYSVCNSVTIAPEGRVSNFINTSDSDEEIANIETSLDVKPTRVRVKGTNASIWNDMEPSVLSSIVNTHGVEVLYNTICSNVRLAEIASEGRRTRTHILGLCGSYAVINRHCFGSTIAGTVYMSNVKEFSEFDIRDTKKCIVTELNSVYLGDDILIVDMGAVQFKDVTKHLLPDLPFIRFANGSLGNVPLSITLMEGGSLLDPNGTYMLKNCYMYKFKGHKPGTCGLPLLLDHGDRSAILGIHVGGLDGDCQAFASPLRRDKIMKAIESLKSSFPLIPLHSSPIIPEMQLVSPVKKSPFRYENFHKIRYLGRIEGPIMLNNTSKQKRFPSFFDITCVLNENGIVATETFLPPVMKPKTVKGHYLSPYNVFLNKVNTISPPLDIEVLTFVVKYFTDHIVKGLAGKNVTFISPVTMMDAINGIEKDDYTRRVNASTASGYGFVGKKSRNLPLMENDLREPSPLIKARIVEMCDKYVSGEACGPMNTGSLKDEMRTKSKVDTASTRVFFITPMDYLILSRMMLSPFYTLLVEFGEIFGAAIGVNMHTGADSLIRELLDFSPLFLEGDYKSYDICTPADVARAASTVVYNVCEALGYTEYSLKIVLGILTDDIFPLMELNNDVYTKEGEITSGRYATTESNCIRGMILLMYAWYKNERTKHLDFFTYVKPKTFGDDVLGTVKEEVAKDFNVMTYSDMCKEYYDMSFTAATKLEASRPFESIETCSFLKRHFVLHPSGKYIAPLDPNSIHKALTWYLPSTQVTFVDQTLSTFISMCYEIFFHTTKEQYDKIRAVLVYALSGLMVTPINDMSNELPTFELLYSRLIDYEQGQITCESLDVKEGYLARSLPRPALIDKNGQLACHAYKSPHDHCQRLARNRNNIQNLMDTKERCNRRIMEIDNELLQLTCPNLPLSALCHNSAIYENMDLYNSVVPRRNLIMEREDLLATLSSVDHILGKSLVFRAESLDIDTVDMGPIPSENVNRTQNVMDLAGGDIITSSAGRSLSLNNGQSGYYPIEEFLERPIEIATGTIAVGASVSAIYPVFDLVTKSPAFRAKVKNFGFGRFNLRLRIAISGSPFHYGRIVASPQPHAGKNRNLAAHASNIAVDAAYRPMLLNYLSQAEGTKIMNVRSNTPVEIVMPFISPKPMGRFFNASSAAIAAATSFSDFADMGSLYFYTMAAIGSVATGSSSIGYSIFAWLEDVELCVPTATHLAITTESFDVGSKADERKVGPVESIASALADLSAVACLIPGLELYAAPATIVFNGAKALAAHFGWSRPHLITEPSFVKNRPFTNSANCIGSETVEMLSYDPMRELSVDSLACASSKDDMAITTIAMRESYFDTFTWANTDAAYSVLKQYIVHPQQNTYYVDSGATACTMVQPSALSFAASAFDYWRGDIVFRLDFVTSQFHRGKLAVWFEPNTNNETLIAADLALNKNDVQIIDISVTDSVEIVVKWASSFPWLKTYLFTGIKGISNPSGLILNLTDVINGNIMIAPFVPLQSPDGSSIRINTFVRAENILFQQLGGSMPLTRALITPESLECDYMSDSESESTPELVIPFYDPRALSAIHSGYQIPMGYRIYPESEEVDCLADEMVTKVDLNPTDASLQDITKHYFGEQPLSFRALLKRYSTIEVIKYTFTATHEQVRAYRNIIPTILPLYNSTILVSPVFPTLYGYLRYAFLGLRGGTRQRIRFLDTKVKSTQSLLVCELTAPVTTVTEAISEPNFPTYIYAAGAVQCNPHISGGAEVEFPFYTQNNFVFSFADDLMGSAVEGEMARYWTKAFFAHWDHTGVVSDVVWMVRDFAAAEDFTLMRFCGAPYYTY